MDRNREYYVSTEGGYLERVRMGHAQKGSFAYQVTKDVSRAKRFYSREHANIAVTCCKSAGFGTKAEIVIVPLGEQ